MRPPRAVRWSADGRALEVLDQTRLPEAEVWLTLQRAEDVAEAIRALRVRGAPAIGIAAAMGTVADLAGRAGSGAVELRARLAAVLDLLGSTRPTAVNLRWALERLRQRASAVAAPQASELVEALRDEANRILEEDRAMCARIGEHGLALLPEGPARVLTHCNAGALATGGTGTALAPVYLAVERGRPVMVWVDETRPLLQGSRITAWELERAGIDATVVVDSVAGSLMRAGRVDLVLVGADRIAANGDVANKIGTYGLAVLARHHGVPFYVAAPTSTLDPNTARGDDIPIEERGGEEVRRGFGRLTAPAGAAVFAPAFDITPAELVTAIITDRAVLRPPYALALRRAGAESGEPHGGAPGEGASRPARTVGR